MITWKNKHFLFLTFFENLNFVQFWTSFGPIFGPNRVTLDLRYDKLYVETKLELKFYQNRYLGSQVSFV